MSKNLSQLNGKTALWYCLLIVLVIVIDQATKLYFENRFELYESVEVIAPFFNWTLAYNHGAAFSFLANQGGWQKWFFALLGILVATGICGYLAKIDKSAKLLCVGLAGVAGGAIGNVIDRIRFGYVIDFIHIHWADVWHYPIFNVADMAIMGGMALVVWDMLFLEKKRTKNSDK